MSCLTNTSNRFQVSNKIPSDGGLLALSPDGQYFSTTPGKQVVVSSCSTLQNLTSFSTSGSVTILKFSPDSKHVSWLSSTPSSLNICNIAHKDVLEIPVKPGLALISITYGLNCLLYISELEVFIGVYDFAKHTSFTLEGCSLDDFDRPLLTFSPNDDYLVYVKGHQLVVYCTETWNLKALFNTPVVPAKPVFVNPYTIFLYNHDGVIEWFSIFGTKIKSDTRLPSKCIVDTELSKDRRTLFGSTFDNKVLCFDTVSMERKVELEYVYFSKPQDGVRTFIASEVEQSKNVNLLKFKATNRSPTRELKNLMDQFKRKTLVRHFTVLNHDDTLLATYNPDNLDTVWVWDFSKENRFDSVISLTEAAGKMNALKWHGFSNRLAVCCSNLVVIWTKCDDLLGFQGMNMNFKWLNIKAAVGVLTSDNDCRFVYLE